MSFQYFIQHNYGLLLSPLVVLAIVHGIAFVIRRCFLAFVDDSPIPAEEPTQQSEQVIQLQNEIKRLRAELDIANGQAAQTLLSKSTPLPAIAKLVPTSPA